MTRRGIAVGMLASAGGLAAWLALGGPRVTEYAVAPVELNSRVLHTGDHLGLPLAVRAVGTHLLISDAYGERGLHVVDRATGALEASVARPGEGPSEMMSPASILVDPRGDPWVLDLATQRLTRVDLARLDGDGWADTVLPLRNGQPVMDAAWTRDGRLLGEGFFTGERFGIFGADGVMQAETGGVPGSSGDLPAAVRMQLYVGRMAAHPDGRRFVTAAQYASRIEFFDDSGRVTGAANVPVPFEPAFDIVRVEDRPVAKFRRDSPLAYMDIEASASRVFALFSGRRPDEWKARDTFARDIHVFDWSGEFVAVLRLDRDVIDIGLDPDGRRLYAIAHDPVPAILEVDLPRSLWSEPSTGNVAGPERVDAKERAVDIAARGTRTQ